MDEKEIIGRLLLTCINSAVSELPSEERFVVSEETLLLAEGSAFDSLQLVSIIVDFEEALSRTFNATMCLTTDDALMGSDTPFRSVKTLTEYAEKILFAR